MSLSCISLLNIFPLVEFKKAKTTLSPVKRHSVASPIIPFGASPILADHHHELNDLSPRLYVADSHHSLRPLGLTQAVGFAVPIVTDFYLPFPLLDSKRPGRV